MLNFRSLGEIFFKSLILILILGFSIAFISDPKVGAKNKLKVLNAGSLMIPFNQIEEKFEQKHPDVDVQIEGHGSIQVIRHITEIQDSVDVAAVADFSLIPLLMYKTTLEGSDKPYANWYIKFAVNNLGIAYTENSKHWEEINEENWFKIFQRSGAKFGISDPRMDACGYRALILARLAEDYYSQEKLLIAVTKSLNCISFSNKKLKNKFACNYIWHLSCNA